MNYIPINELRRLESKGLIEDLSVLSNGEVYCRITSSNVAVLSRLANRSDDFEYHQGEYRIHEGARAINCYYVQFKLPVDSGNVNVDCEAISFDYVPQFPECPERDYEYLNGTSIHLQMEEDVGLNDVTSLEHGMRQSLFLVNMPSRKGDAPFIPAGVSFYDVHDPIVRDVPVVAGDRRQVWETQTNLGFGVDDYIIPHTVNYVACPELGRVAPVTYVPELVLMNHIDSINAKVVDEYDVYQRPLFFRNYHRDGTYDLMPVTRDYVSPSISLHGKGGNRLHGNKVCVGSRIRFDGQAIFNRIDTFKFNGILRDSNDVDLSIDVITRTGLDAKVKYDCAGIMVPEFHEGQGVPMEHPTVPDCAARTPSVSEDERVRWVERMSNLMMP